MADKKLKATLLDGSLEQQEKANEEFLNTLTEEQQNRAMSEEFKYLDED